MSRRKTRGFTLVELLVVMAIIMTLLAILLPALRGASDFAKSTVCRSNLRQIATAAFKYASDHHGLMPYGLQNNSYGWTWDMCVFPYLGLGTPTNEFPEEASRFLIGYDRVIKQPGVLACPVDNPSRNWAPDYFLLRSYTSCAGRMYDGPFTYGCQFALSSVRRPEATLMYFDHHGAGNFGAMNWGYFQYLWPKDAGQPIYDLTSATDMRELRESLGINLPQAFVTNVPTSCVFLVPGGYPQHGSGFNTVLIDGSAKNRRMEDTLWPTDMWTLNPYD